AFSCARSASAPCAGAIRAARRQRRPQQMQTDTEVDMQRMRLAITLAMAPVALGATLAIAEPVTGMMDRAGSHRMMAGRMGGCMEMMQGGQRGADKPNDQWRRQKGEGSVERGRE